MFKKINNNHFTNDEIRKMINELSKDNYVNVSFNPDGTLEIWIGGIKEERAEIPRIGE